MFVENSPRCSPPLQQIKPYLENEFDVPSDFLEQLVEERVSEGDCVRNGFVLMNFPKDRKEALGLQVAGVLPTHVIMIEGATVESAAEKVQPRWDPCLTFCGGVQSDHVSDVLVEHWGDDSRISHHV